jgi:RNA polymerase sigma factor (sigma-70 family)
VIATSLVSPHAIDPLDHQGMVLSIADRYRGRGLDFEDLVQEGTLGLIRASRAFRPEDGLQFSTFATKAIRRAIWRALVGMGQPTRLPEEVYMTATRVRSGKVRIDELEPHRRARVADAVRIMEMQATYVCQVSDHRDERKRREAAAEAVDRTRACLDVLGPRDRAIVAAVHGIGTERRTFEAIGAGLEMSRDHVRRHYQVALRRIRRHFDDAPMPARARARHGSHSPARGIYLTHAGTFEVRVSVGKDRSVRGGTFATLDEARAAANELAFKLRGERNYAVPREERRGT